MSATADSKTHVVVIGGGPGGYAAAFKAADLGLQVTLVNEDEKPGGVCLNVGCIPSKALLHVARMLNESHEAAAWGISFAKPKIDLDKLRAYKNSVVTKLTGGLAMLCKARGVRYVQGRGAFTSATSVKVALTAGGEESINFDYAILATGSQPTKIPAFDIGTDRVMDSTGALELKDIPKKLLIVGGGYIGLEMGSVYAALGSEVSVVEMLPALLAMADRDLAAILEKRLRTRFGEIMLETKVLKMEKATDAVTVTFEAKDGKVESKTYDRVLVSIGRRPNSKGVGLETTKVVVNARGWVEVDPQRRTAEPTIFAIGDVAGEPMLAHKAEHEGFVAAEAIAGERVAFAPAAIPAVVFTDPELAWCGLTESEAKAKGIDVVVTKFPWGASGRAIAIDRPDGLTKLILDPTTGRVLGMGIVGVNAGEMISEGVLAVEMAAVASDLALSIHPHPTLSETVMEAGELLHGSALHVMRPKKK